MKYNVSGVLEFEEIGVEPPPIDPPTEPEPPKDDTPIWREPEGEAMLLWPRERPDWAPKWAHVCVRKEDSEAGRTILQMTQRGRQNWMRPHLLRFAKVDADYPAEPGSPGSSMYFPENIGGFVWRGSHKGKPALFMQPYPLMADWSIADSFRICFEPGIHKTFVSAWCHYPVVIAGPNETDLPYIENWSAPRPSYNYGTGVEGNGGISVRDGTDVVIANLRQQVCEPKGKKWGWPRHMKVNQFYRAFQFTPGMNVFYNYHLEGAAMGLNGVCREVYADKCSFKHTDCMRIGYNHALYALFGEKLFVRDCHFDVDGGHGLKSVMANLEVIRSVFHEGREPNKSAGAAIDDGWAGTVSLTDVEIHQYPAGGNPRFLFIGDSDSKRCRGVDGVRGRHSYEKVRVFDREPDYPNKRVFFITSGCPDLKPTEFYDLGGNEYNKLTSKPGEPETWETVPFFKETENGPWPINSD